MPQAPQLLVFRHGSTPSNSDPKTGAGPEKVRGHKDLPLTSEGKQEAKELGRRCASVRIAKIYASNLQRMIYTARAIAAAQREPRPEVVPTARLRSWDLGNFVDQDYEKVMPLLRKYQWETPNAKVPRGATPGESWNEFLLPWLDYLSDRMYEAERNKGRGAIALGTHTWNLRSLEAWLAKGMKGNELDPKVLAADTPMHTGEAILYELRGGKWQRAKEFEKELEAA